MTSVTDVIPTYVPCFSPYLRVREGTYILTLPNIEGVMTNVELSPDRLSQLVFDVSRIMLIAGTAFKEDLTPRAHVTPQAT